MFVLIPDCGNAEKDAGHHPSPPHGPTQPSMTQQKFDIWPSPGPCDFPDCLTHVQTFIYVQRGLWLGKWEPICVTCEWIPSPRSVKPGHSRQSANAHLAMFPALVGRGTCNSYPQFPGGEEITGEWLCTGPCSAWVPWVSNSFTSEYKLI